MIIRPGIQVIGAEGVHNLLVDVQKKTGDLRPVWSATVNPSVSRFFTQRWASAGTHGGERWAPLSPATIRARGRITGGKRSRRFTSRRGGARGGLFAPLWDSGRARASLIKVGPESVLVQQPMRYERGSSVPYLRFHQTGFKVRRWGRVTFKSPRSVPARKIIPTVLPGSLTGEWESAIAKHIETAG